MAWACGLRPTCARDGLLLLLSLLMLPTPEPGAPPASELQPVSDVDRARYSPPSAAAPSPFSLLTPRRARCLGSSGWLVGGLLSLPMRSAAAHTASAAPSPAHRRRPPTILSSLPACSSIGSDCVCSFCWCLLSGNPVGRRGRLSLSLSRHKVRRARRAQRPRLWLFPLLPLLPLTRLRLDGAFPLLPFTSTRSARRRGPPPPPPPHFWVRHRCERRRRPRWPPSPRPRVSWHASTCPWRRRPPRAPRLRTPRRCAVSRSVGRSVGRLVGRLPTRLPTPDSTRLDYQGPNDRPTA